MEDKYSDLDLLSIAVCFYTLGTISDKDFEKSLSLVGCEYSKESKLFSCKSGTATIQDILKYLPIYLRSIHFKDIDEIMRAVSEGAKEKGFL